MIHVSNADKLVIYGYVEGMWGFFKGGGVGEKGLRSPVESE